MFILIFEDGSMQLAKKVTEADLDMADAGVVDIVDISIHEQPKRYENGVWELISDQ